MWLLSLLLITVLYCTLSVDCEEIAIGPDVSRGVVLIDPPIEPPTRPPTEPSILPQTTENSTDQYFCADGVTGKSQFMLVKMVYRNSGRRLSECEKDCMADAKCEAFIRLPDRCEQVVTGYKPNSKAFEGATYLKVDKCQPLPPLARLRRSRVGTVHWWGEKHIRRAKDETNLVHYCYARNTTENCNLRAFGRSANGRSLSFDYDVFMGYAAEKYGECGATQPVQLWKRKDNGDQMWVVEGVTEPDVQRYYSNQGTVFWMWPDYNGVNCPDF